MQDWRKVGKKLLFPPVWIIALLTVICMVALVTIFINGWEMRPLAYISCVLAFYTLTVICIVCWKVLPGYYKSVKSKMHENKYIDRYMTDAVFKSNVGLYRSLAINLIYVVVNAVSGYIYQTYWFVIFAVYYVIIAMMVFWNRGFQYQGFLIYVIALYTFYITVTAVIDMIKYRKYKSPILSITKVIKMASALFSMLFLETAMFAQFGADTSTEVKRFMIILTGAGISVAVVTMAIYMIVQTTREIKQYKHNKE